VASTTLAATTLAATTLAATTLEGAELKVASTRAVAVHVATMQVPDGPLPSIRPAFACPEPPAAPRESLRVTCQLEFARVPAFIDHPDMARGPQSQSGSS
jgi:hypothetical protein